MKKEENKDDVKINNTVSGLIITISREHGTKGKYIGELVAQKLNIPYYYKDIIALAAQESGLDKEFLDNLHEDAPNVLYNLYMSTNAVQQSIVAQEKIIRKIAENGTCVIVGRASDYILRDFDNVINVFIFGPKDFRIKNVMEMYNDTKESATNNVNKSDYTRAAYYRNISGRKWGDPHNYTLCLDASLGMDWCVDQICDLYNKLNK